MRQTLSQKSTLLRPQGIIAVLVLLLGVGGFLLRPSSLQTGQPAEALAVTAETSVPAIDCAVSKCIALTFDDGPDPVFTPLILDTLQRNNVKATFFVMGRHVPGNEALLKRMHAEGHEIGNHSWNHPYFTRITIDQVREEVNSTQAAVTKAGVPAPQLFRPPYGDINEMVASQIPLAIVKWNIDPEDWHPKKRDNLLGHMATFVRPGGIVVMHDTEEGTAQKLESLIAQLKGQSYEIVTVSQALGIAPGQRGLFYSR